MYPDKGAYEVVRISILKNLFVYGALSSEQLELLVSQRLRGSLGDAVGDYFAAVMQDLEAHGEIRSISYTDPLLFELGAA